MGTGNAQTTEVEISGRQTATLPTAEEIAEARRGGAVYGHIRYKQKGGERFWGGVKTFLGSKKKYILPLAVAVGGVLGLIAVITHRNTSAVPVNQPSSDPVPTEPAAASASGGSSLERVKPSFPVRFHTVQGETGVMAIAKKLFPEEYKINPDVPTNRILQANGQDKQTNSVIRVGQILVVPDKGFDAYGIRVGETALGVSLVSVSKDPVTNQDIYRVSVDGNELVYPDHQGVWEGDQLVAHGKDGTDKRYSVVGALSGKQTQGLAMVAIQEANPSSATDSSIATTH